jgi:hypothetical protein
VQFVKQDLSHRAATFEAPVAPVRFSRTGFLSSARVRITFDAVQGEQQRGNRSLDRSFVVARVKPRNPALRQALHRLAASA